MAVAPPFQRDVFISWSLNLCIIFSQQPNLTFERRNVTHTEDYNRKIDRGKFPRVRSTIGKIPYKRRLFTDFKPCHDTRHALYPTPNKLV